MARDFLVACVEKGWDHRRIIAEDISKMSTASQVQICSVNSAKRDTKTMTP